MKRILFTLVALSSLAVQGQTTVENACPGSYPVAYSVGIIEAPAPQIACEQYAEQIYSNDQDVEATFGTIQTDAIGVMGCVPGRVFESGESYGSVVAVGYLCDPADAQSCAEYGGQNYTHAGSTVNSNECVGGCSANMTSEFSMVIPDQNGNPQYVHSYQFDGGGCGDGTPQPPPEPNSTPVHEYNDDPCVIRNSGGGNETIHCMDDETNCGTWSSSTDAGGTETVTGCLASNPPPSGGCVSIGGGDVACDASDNSSPPLPDSGTPGNPATTAFQLADQDGNIVNYYNQTHVEGSTYTTYVDDSGSDPLGGDDPGDGTTNVDVNVEVEFECTWWFCDEPPELEEQDYVTTELSDGYTSLEQSIADVPNGNGFIDAISQSSLVGWASLTGGPCFTLPLTYYGQSFVFDQHCEPWNDYLRPALAFIFFILTAWYITTSFFSVLRAAV